MLMSNRHLLGILFMLFECLFLLDQCLLDSEDRAHQHPEGHRGCAAFCLECGPSEPPPALEVCSHPSLQTCDSYTPL